MDYYEKLGVSKDATIEEIKEAYRLSSKKLHPDVSGYDSHNDFIELGKIYDVLTTASLRLMYDEFGQISCDFEMIRLAQERFFETFNSLVISQRDLNIDAITMVKQAWEDAKKNVYHKINQNEIIKEKYNIAISRIDSRTGVDGLTPYLNLKLSNIQQNQIQLKKEIELADLVLFISDNYYYDFDEKPKTATTFTSITNWG